MKTLIAALLAVALAANGEEWNFGKALPAGGKLRKGSVWRDGGISALDPKDDRTGAGFSLAQKFTLPEAFDFEAEFTPKYCDGVAGHLWDDMLVSYLPKRNNCGMQVILQCANGKWSPRLVFGFGDDTCFATAPFVAVPDGQRTSFKMTYTANHEVVVVFGGETNVCTVSRTGQIAPGKYAPTLGDRVGSCYHPFPGAVHRVAISARERVPMGVACVGRAAFVRGEENAKIRFEIENFTAKPISDVKIETPFGSRSAAALAAGAAVGFDFAVETLHAPGDRAVEVKVSARDAAGKAVSCSAKFTYAIGPRFGERMPTLMWGFAAPHSVLADLGFTHGLDYGLGYNYFGKSSDVERQSMQKLDSALSAGVRLAKSVAVRYPEGEKEEIYYRRTRDGRIDAHKTKTASKPSPEVSNPKMVEAARKLAKMNVDAIGEHPAFAGVLPVSENRDHTFPSFNTEHERYKAETGRDVPKEVVGKTFNLNLAKKRFPDGVVPADDPILAYYRWFWAGGDGWPNYVGAIADEYRKVSGRYESDDPRQKAHPFFSFWDPAVRCPPCWGSGGDNDVLNQWIYAVPEPMNVAGPVEEMFAMAAGNPNQKVMIMTQLICYRAQIAPSNVVVNPEPEWVKRLPRAGFPTIPPDTLQEATWSMIAKPVRGIMYHGWGTIYDTGHQTGYCFTNPKSTGRLRELLTGVVAPLGPTLLNVGRDASSVAILESATTCFMGGPASWGWTAPAITFLQRARLDPRVVYEQTVLRDGLDGVKVLYAPQCQFLTPDVVEKIRAFQKRGGILVADKQLLPALKADVAVPIVKFSAPPASDHSEDVDAMETAKTGDVKTRSATMNAKAIMQRQAADLRRALAEKGFSPRLDSSSPEIVVYSRRRNGVDYAVAVNDKRTFGDYVGQWGRTMEKGMPFSGSVSLIDPAGKVKHVYELSRGGELAMSREGAKVTVPLKYETNDGRFLVFLDEKISKLDVKAGDHLAAGGKLKVMLSVLGESGKPVAAALPVEIRLYDGADREIDGVGYACAKDGVAEVEFLANLDDAPGDWRLVCRDRASGLSVVRAIPRERPGFFKRLFGW